MAKFQPPQSAPPVPSIVISPELANAIFAGERQSASGIFNASYGKTLPPAFLMNDQKKITMSVANNAEIIPTQNVVAVWEGGDPVLKAEYVALGAHYDHVGNGCANVGADIICNGADDNGSGTTALLAMEIGRAHV